MTLGCLIAIARLISTRLNVWRNQPTFAATYGSVALALTPVHITAFFRLNSDFTWLKSGVYRFHFTHCLSLMKPLPFAMLFR